MIRKDVLISRNTAEFDTGIAKKRKILLTRRKNCDMIDPLFF